MGGGRLSPPGGAGRCRNTQNVRRFLTRECGETFRFNRSFMAWIKSGAPRNMGEVADE
ncbi:DUF6434 domain-containing protein [Paraburkholderia sp. GAS41]|uniref:DUF6434 domain-containing protein n=1 Tax=Paraburkholderia sp. GAS41 TaxID=3035134 RepID=UPI003D1EFF5C